MITIIDVKPDDKLERTNLFSNADKGNKSITLDDLNKLLNSFPGAFIVRNMELIVNTKTNAYISL